MAPATTTGSMPTPAAQLPEGVTPTVVTDEGTFGDVTMEGQGSSSDRWQKADVTRDGSNYFLMANGWGPNFQSQTISWLGTAFTIASMEGTQGDNYEPASYPTVFCGQYSDSVSRECGLPAARADIASLKTGWSWRANGNVGQYNAAYDVWLANGPDRSSFSGYFMVWLRDPAGQQPAGMLTSRAAQVPGVEGFWHIWEGMVNRAPIVNFVRAEGDDSEALEFDLVHFFDYCDAQNIAIPGSHVLSVAVGFEIWNGPISNLESKDFYVDVQMVGEEEPGAASAEPATEAEALPEVTDGTAAGVASEPAPL